LRERGDQETFQQVLNARPLARYQLLLVGILLFVLVLDGVDIQLLSLVAPVIIDEWGVERADFGPALAGALVGMSGGALVGGWLGDRYGRLPVLLFATVSFGIATALAGMTSSVAAMTVLRIFSGIGFGAAAPNAIALANEWLPDRVRSQVTSLLSIGTPAGGMMGASLVLICLPSFGWRGTFYACGLATIIVAIALYVFGRESPAFLASKGKSEEAARNARQALGIAWVPHKAEPQHRASFPKHKVGLLARDNARLNAGAGLGFFTVAFVSYAFVAWTTVMLTGLGLPMGEAVGALFSFNLAATAAAVAAGFLVRRLGTRTVLAVASLLLALTILILGFILVSSTQSPNGVLVSILTGAIGGFAGAAMASIYAMMAAGYPVECRAAGLGLGMMLGRAGGILASLVGGHLLDAQDGTGWPFLGALAVAAAAAAGCAFVSDKHLLPLRAIGQTSRLQ